MSDTARHDVGSYSRWFATRCLELRLEKEPGPWTINDLVVAVQEYAPVNDRDLADGLNDLQSRGRIAINNFRIEYVPETLPNLSH